jgi:Ser/Thr protein kinase RdoA (MazF antagonist)
VNPTDGRARLEAALAAWGSGTRIGDRLDSGNRNEEWQVAIGGTPYAARLSTRTPAALAWELDLLHFLRGRGVRVPSIRNTKDGRRHVDGIILFEWLDGEPPSTERDWRAVEDALRRVHLLTHSWRQRPSFRSTLDLLHHDRGGDVRLDLMPVEAVERCRAAWQCLLDEPMSVIHGDPGASNIRISSEGAGIIDWDEARVDASVLDLAALPLTEIGGVAVDRLAQVRTALDAWEAASGWEIEPSYARRRLARLTPQWSKDLPDRG